MKKRKYTVWLLAGLFQVALIAAALAVPGDADGNGTVGPEDLLRVADWWTIDVCDIEMFEDCNGADMTGPNGTKDGVVDFYDFALVADHWLQTDTIS